MPALPLSGCNEYTRLQFSGHQSSGVSFSFLVQDQLHQKDGLSVYPIIDTNKRGMVGTKLLDKLTLKQELPIGTCCWTDHVWSPLFPMSRHSPVKGPALGDRLLHPVLHFQNQVQNGILGRETKLTKPHQNCTRTRNLLSTQCLLQKSGELRVPKQNSPGRYSDIPGTPLTYLQKLPAAHSSISILSSVERGFPHANQYEHIHLEDQGGAADSTGWRELPCARIHQVQRVRVTSYLLALGTM